MSRILFITSSQLLKTVFCDMYRQICGSKPDSDQITSPHTLLYFPENAPSCILFDQTSLSLKKYEDYLLCLRKRFPSSLMFLFTAEKSPQLPDFSFDTILPSDDMEQIRHTLIEYFTAGRLSSSATEKPLYYSLEQSHHFFHLLTSPEETHQIREMKHTRFFRKLFFACIIHTTLPKENQHRILHREYLPLLSSLLDTRPDCMAFEMQDKYLLFLFFSDMEERDDLHRFRQQLIEDKDVFFPPDYPHKWALKCHYGMIHKDLTGLLSSYHEAYETYYTDKLYYSCTAFEEISSQAKNAGKSLRLLEIERKIFNNMEYNQGKDLITYARLWFEECRNLHYSLQDIQLTLICLYASIKYVIFDMYSLTPRRIKNGHEVYEILGIQDDGELEEWFYTWLNYTLNNIESEHYITHLRIADALTFIENHLMENISLETVSGYFFLNPSYFSTIFKKEMGETFSSYVIRLKMQKAAELLQSDRKVYEVAHLLGYEDMKHFRATFRKYYHMTPVEYRNKTKQKKI